ncbi:MAG: ATP-dependent zinc metalloprotease FtsH [Aggregatilineales bacterium]
MFPNNNNNDNNRNGSPPGGKDPNQQPPEPDWRRWAWPAILLVLTLWFVLQFSGLSNLSSGAQEFPYSTLLNEAQDDNVNQVTVREQNAQGTFRSPVTNPATGQATTNFSTTLPTGSNEELLGLLSETAVVDIQTSETSPLLIILFQFAPILLIIGFFVWTARRAQKQMNGAFGFGKTQAREYNVERPQVTFEDVAGQEAAKRELVEIVDFLKEPDKYIALGARIPRGVLLIGPPGTGKTLLARAVAGEANVSFFSIAASEFVEMFVGVGASRVRDLFKRAKDNAPSIVFIDEIDAVGRQRGAGLGGGHDEREQTLNQMLAEMDGFDRTESVIVMAATNRNDVLDPALLRPGRFDRQVTVGLPDKKGRLAILKIHVRGKPLSSDVELDQLSGGTIGFSGADLANLANEAALNAARRNAKKISIRDFSDAFDRIVLGTESPPLTNQRERKVVAYHEAGHALAAAMTPEADPVLKVTIVPRGQALGVTAFAPNDDIRNYTKQYLIGRMVVGLGGRAAEKVVFDDITTGAADDLRRVTDMARRMVSQFGMSDAIGPLNFGDNDRQPFLGYSLSQNRSYSEETAAKIDAEVRRIVEEVYDRTIKLMEFNRDKLEALAEALLEQEVVEQSEMLRLFGITKEKVVRQDDQPAELANHNADKGMGHFSLDRESDEKIVTVTKDEDIKRDNGHIIDMNGKVVEQNDDPFADLGDDEDDAKDEESREDKSEKQGGSD